MLAEFHFLRPEWLIALPLVLVAIVVLGTAAVGGR